MKNKILIYVSLASVLLCVSSCDDYLDKMPDDRAEINSVEKVTKLLVSAYPGSAKLMIAEMYSDNAMDNGSQFDIVSEEQEEAYLWEDIKSTNNDSPKYIWDAHYSAIASANHALRAVYELGDTPNLQPQKGEALICRAFAHFELANLFCLTYNPATANTVLGIPYVDQPETEVLVDYSRETLSETYKKIAEDIEEALPLINDDIYSVPKYHFNTKAAYAFACRFYLYYQKFEKSIEYANVVLGKSPEKQLRDWKSITSMASNFTLRCDEYVNASSPANLLLITAKSSWPYTVGPYSLGKRYGNARPIIINESLRASGIWGASSNLYPAKAMWGFDEKLSMPKFNGYFEYTDKTAGIGYRQCVNVAFSTNETLLCRAESYILTGDFQAAVDDINTWITVNTTASPFTKEDIVNYYTSIECMPTTISDDSQRTIKKAINPQGFTVAEGEQEQLIHCILHLRRIETLHEGLRLFDIKRYGIEISHNRDGMKEDILTVDDLRRAIQLPQDVISAGLAANPR